MYENFVYYCIARGKRYHIRPRLARKPSLKNIGRGRCEGARKANFEPRKLLLYGPRAEMFFLEFSEKMSQR